MIALAVLGGIVSVGFLMAFRPILNGCVLKVLWGWFVVPTFGAPSLGIVPAIGLAMAVSCLTYQIPNWDEEEANFGEKILMGASLTILKACFALFFGWIVHLFM